jgi:hypothetical protein
MMLRWDDTLVTPARMAVSTIYAEQVLDFSALISWVTAIAQTLPAGSDLQRLISFRRMKRKTMIHRAVA